MQPIMSVSRRIKKSVDGIHPVVQVDKRVSRQLRSFWISMAVFLCTFVIVGLVLAWANPTATPPGGNVAAPLNAGATTQTKTGGLNVLGNFGIGLSNPSAKLDIAGASSTISNTVGNITISPTGNLVQSTGNFIVSSGSVGIGTSSPATLLDVAGTSWLRGAAGTTGLYVNSSGNVGIGTTTPQAKLDVAGSIKSTMWKVSKPIAFAGAAYPRSGTFTSNGGTLMIFASGAAYRSAAGTMQVDVELDGVVQGSLKAYTNEASSHKALNSDVIVLTGIGAGSHTVELTLVDGSSDANDYSQVTVLELPF